MDEGQRRGDRQEQPASGARTRRVPRTVLVGVAVLALLGLVYTGDLLLSRGDVPRGTVVAGEDVGGAAAPAAEAQLRAAFAPRVDAPVTVVAGEVTVPLDPAASGLSIDWPATLEQAGQQPGNPVDRVRGFVDRREVGIVTAVDRAELDAAVAGLGARVDRPVVEGALSFDDGVPVAVEPVSGRTLEVAPAADAIAAEWFTGDPVEVPVTTQDGAVTAAGLATALDTVAAPAVAGPFTVTGEEGATAVLEPAEIGSLLSFAPDGSGGLAPTLDRAAVVDLLATRLSETPSAPGRTVDWDATVADPLAALTTPGECTVPAVYVAEPVNGTTEGAQDLGIREVIGEFTTGGFVPASGVNIRQAAQDVNGAVVLPGETFSLNGRTGPRSADQGYVESGIIRDGRAGTGLGGGVSQFATTLYNAAYFAGLTDVEHREHSYYIPRYPAAREATVLGDAIDLKFAVPTDTGILIEAFADEDAVTVRIWGTKTVDVESIAGDRRSPTSPETLRLDADDECAPFGGASGFTVSDTRVVRDLVSGAEISRETRTVTYNPQPEVICE